MKSVLTEGRVPVKLWAPEHEVEEGSLKQLRNLATLPFAFKHVAAMPDVHWGNGTSVGAVVATEGAIIPAAVGVDIGCGMVAAQLSLRADDLPDDLGKVRAAIEAAVPHGRTDNGGANDRGAWNDIPVRVLAAFDASLGGALLSLMGRHPKLTRAGDRASRQLGTLGTGNHFIEVSLDTENNVWVMLHSGSRGIGNAIGSYFIERAKEHMRQYFINLPDEELAYLPDGTDDFRDYWDAVSWAQEYAATNRTLMMQAVVKAMRETIPKPFGWVRDAVNCHHNYVAREHHFGRNILVTRKGAVRARQGDLGIIPGSMGTRSYIVRGLGNPESFMSCAHGAGRRMGRKEAKRRFTVEDLLVQTAGVECRKDADVIDEIPAAYKDIDQVMENQKDLVEIVATLKAVICVKG